MKNLIPWKFHGAAKKVVETVDSERDPSYFYKASVIVLTKGWSKLASTWTRVSKLEILKCFRGSKNPARCARTSMFSVTIAGKGWGGTILFFSLSNSLGRLRSIRLNARARAFLSFSTAASSLLLFLSYSVLVRLGAIIEVYESRTNPKQASKFVIFCALHNKHTNLQCLSPSQQTSKLVPPMPFTTTLIQKTLDLLSTTNPHLINQCTKEMKGTSILYYIPIHFLGKWMEHTNPAPCIPDPA